MIFIGVFLVRTKDLRHFTLLGCCRALAKNSNVKVILPFSVGNRTYSNPFAQVDLQLSSILLPSYWKLFPSPWIAALIPRTFCKLFFKELFGLEIWMMSPMFSRIAPFFKKYGDINSHLFMREQYRECFDLMEVCGRYVVMIFLLRTYECHPLRTGDLDLNGNGWWEVT